jgi:hypothetical protein
MCVADLVRTSRDILVQDRVGWEPSNSAKMRIADGRRSDETDWLERTISFREAMHQNYGIIDFKCYCLHLLTQMLQFVGPKLEAF